MLTVHYSGLNRFLHDIIVISMEPHCVLFMFAYEAFFFSLPLCNLFTVCNLSVLSFLFLFFQNCSYCLLCLMFCFCEGYPLSYWPLSLFSVYIDKNIQVCIFVVLIYILSLLTHLLPFCFPSTYFAFTFVQSFCAFLFVCGSMYMCAYVSKPAHILMANDI